MNVPLITNGVPEPESTHGDEPALSVWLAATVSVPVTVVVAVAVLVLVFAAPVPKVRFLNCHALLEPKLPVPPMVKVPPVMVIVPPVTPPVWTAMSPVPESVPVVIVIVRIVAVAYPLSNTHCPPEPLKTKLLKVGAEAA